MREKDIENLISKHPEEFLPYPGLKLVGQQVMLDTYRADIIFEDNKSNKIVIEVKKGILTREVFCQAVVQIMDYYGIIRIQERISDIKLIIVANFIPEERVKLFEEKLGIKFIAIPDAKLIKVAKEYSYSFLDEPIPKTKIQYRKQIQEMDKNISLGKSKVWIFQTKPLRFDILNALEDPKVLKDDAWMVTRYEDEIKKGHYGIVWMAGKNSGIYALSKIMSNPEEMREPEHSAKYWMYDEDKNQARIRVKLKYTLPLSNENKQIFREELKSIDELKGMEIFRRPIGTNFKVTPEEWKAISELLKERFNV